ncbi:MAG TPA: CAP domain-containing protein, partial [Thermoanaerobaculia bacterium]|nr:CAP domain-containing protein [Thermoanaerobaculia bacterium]
RGIREAGYLPHGWTEGLSVVAGDVETVVRYFKAGASFQAAMSGDYRDLGVGLATLRGVPLYVFLFAWPESDFFARQIAGISDLAAVRREMLEEVNAARRAAGRSALVADARLDAAAQEHAQDMLTRAYYDHQTPEGRTPRQRLEAAGYLAHKVGENIAEGQFSVKEVMSGWLASSGHRQNLLDASFTELGVGLAIGRLEDRLRILWVQDFAVPGI